MHDLSSFLTERGYSRVPLRRSAVGHFHTTGSLNGRPVEILVDSGAACTVVAMGVARALGLRTEGIEVAAGGAGGAFEQFRVEGADLRLEDFVPHLAALVGIEFEHVNAPLRAQGSEEVDVILGVDVFDAHAAVLDFAACTLFLKAAPSGASSPAPAARPG